MKRNLLILAYDNEKNLQLLKIPRDHFSSSKVILSFLLRFYCVIHFVLNMIPCSLSKQNSDVEPTSLPRGTLNFLPPHNFGSLSKFTLTK